MLTLSGAIGGIREPQAPLVRQRPPQRDMVEYAAHSVVLYAGVHLADEGLPVGVVSIARRQGLVFGLECSDVGGCDTKGFPSLLQLFKPDRFPYPHGNQINAIHICIINPTIRRLKVTGSRYPRGRTGGVSNPALQTQRKLAPSEAAEEFAR